MENPTQQQQPYLDSPSSSQPPSPTLHASPSPSHTTIKPLPALPHHARTYSDEQPYRDDPHDAPPYQDAPPNTPSHHSRHHSQPYTDAPAPDADTDNIPLAHLLHFAQTYPSDAPPSYSVAIRETHTHRDTLIQYIPRADDAQHAASYRPVVIEFDAESGEVVARSDDVRHSVEKVVAMFVVAGVLLVVSFVLAWLVVGSGVFW